MNLKAGFVHVAWILAATCSAVAQSPASRPVKANDAQRVSAPKEIQAGMDRLAQALQSTDAQERQEAMNRLRQVQQAYTEEVLRLRQDSDAEVRTRMAAARDELVQCAREAWVLGHLDLRMRKALQSVAVDAPDLYRNLMTGSLEAAMRNFPTGAGQGANALVTGLGAGWGGGSDDTQPKLTQEQMEAVFFLAMHNPNPGVQFMAVRASEACKVKSESLADAVTDLLAGGIRDSQVPGMSAGSVQPAMGLGVIARGATPRVVGKLMAMYLAQPSNAVGLDVLLVEAAARTGELGIIPTLIDRLKKTDECEPTGAEMTRAPSDSALSALLILTGQQDKDYGMVRSEVPAGTVSLGFKDAQARAAAIKKFTNWWDQHKDQAPYKDLKPLELPKSPLPRIQVWEY